MRFFRRWWAWFRPRKGWKTEFLLHGNGKGQTVWPVPGKPEADKVIPWPLVWIPHQLSDHPRGFDFEETVCVESGEILPAGVGVLCLRCQVPLHPRHAHMIHGFSPPHCGRCRPIIKWVSP